MTLANLNASGWLLLAFLIFFTLGVLLIEVPRVGRKERSGDIGGSLMLIAAGWTWLLYLVTP